MKALQTLAKMLGVPSHQAEDALHSESAARAVLSRRNLFAAGAAMAAGSLLVGGPLPLRVFHDDVTWYAAHSWADYAELLKESCGWDDDDEDLTETLEASTEEKPHKLVSVCWDPVEREITDNGEHKLRASFDWWAKREGRGILFGTEY
jgi:hypothetical protein